jgi:DNA mismatch repair protein MutS
MALIKEYFELTKKYQEDYGEKTILLMQVGSFFEVYGLKNKIESTIYGSQILDFSVMCDLNVVEKNVCVGKENVVMAGFKDMYVDKYVRKIQDDGFTAVVYTQDEAAKNTKRSLAGIFSPGTYFSNDSTKLTNNITCIWVDLVNNKLIAKGKYVVVGVANMDIYTGKTSIFQFKEVYMNNPTTYDELERFISIYNPSETIFISNLPEKEIQDIIHYVNLRSSLIHKICIHNEKRNPFILQAENCEKQVYQKEILSKFYKIHDFDVFFQNFYENNVATQAFCFLLDFVYQHNPHLVNKITEPVFENCSNRLILANHSLKQLNIIDDHHYNGKYSSVVKMLNECLTPMGKRKFTYSFLNPVTDAVFLQKEYDMTDHMINKHEDYSSFLKIHLSEIKDIAKWERQIFLKKITPKSFYQLHQNLQKIKDMYTFVMKDSVITNYIQDLEKNSKQIGYFCDTICDFICSHLNLEIICNNELLIQNSELNFIQSGVDVNLDSKSLLLKESELRLETIRQYLNSLIMDKGKTIDFVKIHETEKNNFTLICTSRRCKLLEESLPTIVTETDLSYNLNNQEKQFSYKIGKKRLEYKTQTAANNSITDEEIKRICSNISLTKVCLKDMITFVFNQFVEKFEAFQEELESIIYFITLIDLLYAKSVIAQKYNYCKPVIREADKSFFTAKGLRHCLIEQIQTTEMYVSNNVELGNGVVDGILLYGTNAVGKTSLIRSIGITILMAQAGFYVPCKEFIYKPYQYLFTRILGNDNIFKGLSTFAVEMSELRTILRLADENSLILGDELCSGTENTSAISIFVAGIQKLHSCKSSFIFATHLHEIVEYEEISSLESVQLKHMTVIYNKEQDILIYDRKLKDGSGDSMYGLEVCKSLSLPQDFLELAYQIRVKYNPEKGSLLSLKTSHFNSKKIMNNCEKCGKNIGTEVHHLQHQKDSDINGYIYNCDGIIFKNSLANLLTLCETCHNEFHKNNLVHHRKIKTSKGNILKEL